MINGRTTSELRSAASRANGAKSRGPTTPEGKRASSQNATSHGLLSGTIVLKGESQDRFSILLNALLEEFQPQTHFENSLIEDMAAARWRRMRIWGMEKAGMEYEIDRQEGSFDATHDSATRAALAFRALADNSHILDLINRYDSRYQRDYLRAHRRFLECRDRRPPPEPVVPEMIPDMIPDMIPEVEPEDVIPPKEPSPAGDPQISLSQLVILVNAQEGNAPECPPNAQQNLMDLPKANLLTAVNEEPPAIGSAPVDSTGSNPDTVLIEASE